MIRETPSISPLTDINADNVQRLKVAWQWQHGEGPRDDYGTVPGNFETTPLMIDGVLYVTTPYNNVAALDAATGKELWRFDGEAYKLGQIPGTGFKHRGAAAWRDGDRLRIFLNSRTKLFSLDAATGKPVPSFGTGGSVSLTQGFPKKVTEEQVTQGSPPVVYKNLVIVAHAVPDRYQLTNDPPGIVQAFNARTGKLRLGVQHHPAGARRLRRRHLGQRVVAIHRTRERLGADDARRGTRPSLSPDQHAEQRLLRRQTAGRQPVRRIARLCRRRDRHSGSGTSRWCTTGSGTTTIRAAPNLVTITVDGKRIDAVVQVTKQGFAYVFDRVTGEPGLADRGTARADRLRRARRAAVSPRSRSRPSRRPSRLRAFHSTMRTI